MKSEEFATAPRGHKNMKGMKKNYYRTEKRSVNMMVKLLGAAFFIFLSSLFISCSDSEDGGQPRIDSVWYNMVSQPVEQAPCAYPGQVICIRGGGFSGLRQLIVNDTEINLNTLFVYQSADNITFQLPSDVSTNGDYIKVVTANGQTTFPFVVRPTEEQPVINAFSANTLIAGRTLVIAGSNLDGVTEVWLPLAFGGRIRCEFDSTQTNDNSTIYVVVPAEATFATGRCEVVMEKYDAERNITYTEKTYSATTNFIN